jgi:hypothetical protein
VGAVGREEVRSEDDPSSPPWLRQRDYAGAREIGTCERLKMIERRGYRIDRRSGADRRKIHDLNYFIRGGVERRKFKERRSQGERRKNWLRVDEWVSVFVGKPVRRDRRRISSLQNIKEDNGLSSGTDQRHFRRDHYGGQFQNLSSPKQ